MLIQELIDILYEGVFYRMDPTWDKIIVGSADRAFHKVGVCFKLTAELIQKASKAGMDFIICHEAVFGNCGDDPSLFGRIEKKKHQMLVDSGITVFRYHDHAHNRENDYICDGFIKALCLDVEKLPHKPGTRQTRYILKQNMTAGEIAKLAKSTLGLQNVRLAGNKDQTVKTLYLALGAMRHQDVMDRFETDFDLLIAGEIGAPYGAELYTPEIIRDAHFFGEPKNLLLLGHCGAEYVGMRYLAELLQQRGIDATYLHCTEPYERID